MVEKLQGENLASDREATIVAVDLLRTVLLPQTEQNFVGASFASRADE
jgi:hypothetical protein